MSEAALSIDEQFDGSEEEFENEKTPLMRPHSMKELMDSLSDERVETIHSPGIPTLTSDRPTRPIRPSVMARYQ